MTLANALGISKEHLLTLRAEAQRIFEHELGASIPFYKTLRRAILVRIVAWYQRSVNRASGRYAYLLAEAAAHHKRFRPEVRQAIEEEVQDFAREKIDQREVRVWSGLFWVNRNEPGFTKMVTKVVTELACRKSSLISEAKANLNRAATIYGEEMRGRNAEDVPVAQKVADPARYPMLTVAETQQYFRKARSTIYRWADEGKLKRASLGRSAGKRGSCIILTDSVRRLSEESAV